jgi:hypothetical protein
LTGTALVSRNVLVIEDDRDIARLVELRELLADVRISSMPRLMDMWIRSKS